MTLHEIEETVQTLASRHQRLDEAMLVTLLRAGGWEEKDVEEGKMAFRHLSKEALTEAPAPSTQPEALPTLSLESGDDHLLPEHAEPDPLPDIPVQESLVSSSEVHDDKDDLPHNLPLRPFETSEHIWPFSRYKDVFFGNEETFHPEPAPVPTVEVPKKEEVREVPTPAPVVVEKKQPQAPAVAHIAPAQLSKGDEKLVITAAIMLLCVLMLLGYMYQNGRL
jgi:hypothetical protein